MILNTAEVNLIIKYANVNMLVLTCNLCMVINDQSYVPVWGCGALLPLS